MAVRVNAWRPGEIVSIEISRSGLKLAIAIAGATGAGTAAVAIAAGSAFAQRSPAQFMASVVAGSVAAGLVLMMIVGALTTQRLRLDWNDRTVRIVGRGATPSWSFSDIKAVVTERELVSLENELDAPSNRTTRTIVRLWLEVADRRFLLDDGYEVDGLPARADTLAAALGTAST